VVKKHPHFYRSHDNEIAAILDFCPTVSGVALGYVEEGLFLVWCYAMVLKNGPPDVRPKKCPTACGIKGFPCMKILRVGRTHGLFGVGPGDQSQADKSLEFLHLAWAVSSECAYAAACIISNCDYSFDGLIT